MDALSVHEAHQAAMSGEHRAHVVDGVVLLWVRASEESERLMQASHIVVRQTLVVYQMESP